MRHPQAKHQLRSTASIVGIEGSRGREDEERVGRGRGGGASEEEGALWDDYKQMDVDLDRAALGPKLWYNSRIRGIKHLRPPCTQQCKVHSFITTTVLLQG